jgi:hypothetical protein
VSPSKTVMPLPFLRSSHRRASILLFVLLVIFIGIVISIGIIAPTASKATASAQNVQTTVFTQKSLVTTSAQKTLMTFCQALVEKDFQTAYDQFSSQLQQHVLKSEIMKSYSACTTAPSTVSNAHPQCTLRLTTETDKKYWRVISLSLDQQHIWKISSWGISHKG